MGVTWIMLAIQSELSSGMNWVGPSLFPWLLLYSGRDSNSVTCRVFSAVPLDIPLFWSLWPQRTIVTTVLFLSWSWSRLSPGSSCLFSFKIYYLGPYLQALKNVISKGAVRHDWTHTHTHTHVWESNNGQGTIQCFTCVNSILTITEIGITYR